MSVFSLASPGRSGEKIKPMPKRIRLLLAAGGTGGHLFPGIAVAQAAERQVGAELLFVGTKHGMEQEVIPRLGFALRLIPAEQLRGRSWWGRLHALWTATRGIGSAARIIRTFGPDLIFSIGGYASGPTVVAGWLHRIPCVLLEPNVIPGLTNRLLARLATRVCVGFPRTVERFPAGKAVWTGNPVRWPMASQAAATHGSNPEAKFTILIIGGSAGARRLNQTLPLAFARLHSGTETLHLIHQTGKADYNQVQELYQQAGLSADVMPFIDAMDAAYAAADLVICRAGANTVAELAALGKPAIFVPYPYAADDHQRANAEVLVEAGAARMILDAELTAQRIVEEIQPLMKDRAGLAVMQQAAFRAGRPQATAAVVQECLACLRSSADIQIDTEEAGQ